jgi:hypothetical protein
MQRPIIPALDRKVRLVSYKLATLVDQIESTFFSLVGMVTPQRSEIQPYIFFAV